MISKLSLLLFSMMFCTLSYGQSDFSETTRNNAYVEILGNGGIYSVNYERIVVEHFALRLGFGVAKTVNLFFSDTNDKTTIIAVPVLGSLLFGERKSKLELGAGFLFGHKNVKSASGNSKTGSAIFDLTGVVGYRYQPSSGGFLFRIGITPFYTLNGGENAYPQKGFFISGGLSIGYNF